MHVGGGAFRGRQVFFLLKLKSECVCVCVTSDDGEYVVFVSRGLSGGGFSFSVGNCCRSNK